MVTKRLWMILVNKTILRLIFNRKKVEARSRSG
jgi:hypothetical protein